MDETIVGSTERRFIQNTTKEFTVHEEDLIFLGILAPQYTRNLGLCLEIQTFVRFRRDVLQNRRDLLV